MLAKALRLALVLELAIYFILARYGFGAAPRSAALFAVAGLLALRAFVIALTFTYAWVYRSPRPALTARQTLCMALGEYAAMLLNFVLISPFENWWMGADRLQTSADGAPPRPPILLVHGYACSRASWWWLRRRLRFAGWQVATINLEPIYASIDDYVEPLAQRIDAVLAATGTSRLVLVGHSMGGLVSRAYLQRFGAAKVARLVTLGTPHRGSRLATTMGIGPNGRQMRPGSPWLENLAIPPPAVDTLVIHSPHDNFVMPQSHLLLPNSAAQAIVGLGHLAMIFSPRIERALLDAFAQTAARQRADHG